MTQPLSARTQTKRILRATAVVAALALVVRGLGFLEKLVLAYFFGTGMEVDAYLVAYSLPFSAFIVLRDVVGPAFLPTYLRTCRDSEPAAWRLFAAAGTWLALLLGAATAAGMLLAGPLVHLAAPGFAGEQRVLAVRLTRIAMPALLVLGISTLTTATLHARKRFAVPALGEASFRTAPLLAFLAMGRVEGLALGVGLGALGKLAVEALGLRRHLGPLRPALDAAFGPLRTAARLAAPLLMGLFFSLFVGPLVDNAFASRLGVGGVSALAYARKIGETLTSILPYTLGLVLFPFSSEMAADQDRESLAATLTAAIRALALLFVPVTLGLVVLRVPFVRLLLERGAFTVESTQLTAGPLLFYALGLLPFALEIIVVRFFYARQDTLTPVVTDVVTFALDVALIPPLMGLFGLGGIALATAIAKTLKVLALLVLFGRRVTAFRLAGLGRFAGQIAGASLVAAAALYGVLLLGLGEKGGLAGTLAGLAAGGAAGGGAFFVAAYWLGVGEVRDVWRRLLSAIHPRDFDKAGRLR